MASLRVLKYALALIVLQQSAQVLAKNPRDSVVRKGIIEKLLTEAEANAFSEEVTIDGVVYKQAGANRQQEVEDGRYLALLQRYVQSTYPNKGFDLLILTQMTGIKLGKFVTGGKLLPLKDDMDVDDAIIEMEDPPGLEFVLINKQCSFIKKDETTSWKTYDCGNDNYKAYA